MAMIYPGELVTVKRYVTDKYGDRVLVSEFQVRGAFAPTDTREPGDRSEQAIADATFYSPTWAGIQPSDVVERADGSTWEVEGRAEEWASPWTGWRPGSVIYLRRT